MYKHILIPTDGTVVAQKAVKSGIAFAKSVNAKVTFFTAVDEYRTPSASEVMSRRAVSPAQHEAQARRKAEKILAPLRKRAAAASLECGSDFALNDRPYDAIIRAAMAHRCDLIFMASHGRRGIRKLVYGSQTQGVLTHSTIPTLVYR